MVVHGGSTVFTLSFNVACVGEPYYKKLRLPKMLSTVCGPWSASKSH